MKKLSLLFAFKIFIMFNLLIGQNVRNNTILVYFLSGIQTEEILLNGESIKKSKITSKSLRTQLLKNSIHEDSIAPAFPKFNRNDTLRYLPDGSLIQQADLSRVFTISFPKHINTKKVAETIATFKEILYAEPNGIAAPCAEPDDSLYNFLQWNMNNLLSPGRDINAEMAWEIFTGNPNNIIAIIDGEIDVNHYDLNDKMIGSYSVQNSGSWQNHGTHVAGIAAAESNNKIGVSGVDWKARIYAKNIQNTGDIEKYQAIIDAVDYNQNVFVINNSYGLMYSDSTPGRYSTILRQAVAYAYKNNRIFVASMGNFQNTFPNVINYPSGYPNVIAVGSTNSNDLIQSTSVHGNYIDVCAPGVGIYSTLSGNTYDFMSGTSMAAPHVSGLASLLKGYNSNLANDDVENIIKLSADKTPNMTESFDNIYGFGRINAGRAISYLSSPFSLTQLTTSAGTIANSSNQLISQFISATGLPTAYYLVKKIEVLKTISLPDNLYKVIGIWGRGVHTTGWRNESPNFGEGFCEIVPGSLTNTSATLRTYVYEIWSISGSYLGHYPASPNNVTMAYSVLGYEKPKISGSTLICDQSLFSLSNLPETASVVWSTSNDLCILTGQYTDSITIARTNDLALSTFVKATITIDNSVFVVEKTNLQIGTLNPTIRLYDSLGRYELSPPYFKNNVYTIVADRDGLSSLPADFNWVVNQPSDLNEPPFIFNGKQFTFIAENVGNYIFSLQYNGECG